MNYLWKLLVVTVLFVQCQSTIQSTQELSVAPNKAKFEPEDGKVLLFVGQELDAIGGLDDYNDGYLDHFDPPAGFTMYTKIRPGDESYGFTISGLSGVVTTDDWGDGDSNMQMQIDDEDYANMALAIGLELVNHEIDIAAGKQDSLVIALGKWIKSLGDRPVFLRTGYEFHGEWNHYDQQGFIDAYRRIKDTYDSMGIDNIAYVWQSHGFGEPLELLESWYPGDDYVDWCGFSFFNMSRDQNMVEFARSKGKPVFIAEATPTLTDEANGGTIELILSNPDQAEVAWQEWFVPFFKLIDDNPETIKAISYINANWLSRPMWKENPTFMGVDARLHTNEDIMTKWQEVIGQDKYIKSDPNLFDYLKGKE
ncbi:MAG: hypothetical protein JXQ90_12080 [Cyclobacteriaceae bacterium]